MVARDGGIFSFGDAPFYGSLPGHGLTGMTDIVGMAPTPTNRGYWIASSQAHTLRGPVYAFGDALSARTCQDRAILPSCDPVAAIFSNPKAIGFRLVTQSGATLPFGNAPGGKRPTGTPVKCPPTASREREGRGRDRMVRRPDGQ